jgi:hypothetical protein
MTNTLVTVSLLLAMHTGVAFGESLSVRAVMTPREQIRGDLPTPDKHFVLFVRREGRAAGSGPLNGAALTEYGMHDIRPGFDGSPRGYLVATLPNGEHAVIQWEVQATFIPGADGKPKLLDNGVWRLIGGTGSLAQLKGAGILHIRAAGPEDREFVLEGELVSAKP